MFAPCLPARRVIPSPDGYREHLRINFEKTVLFPLLNLCNLQLEIINFLYKNLRKAKCWLQTLTLLFRKNIQDSMKIFKAVTFCILITTVLITACSTSKNNLRSQLKGYSPKSGELYDSIAYLDSIFFNAFNTKDLDKLKAFLSDDLEFYHDLGGVTNYTQNIDAFKRTFESERKLRRELVRGSLEVFPIKDYGAVETGIHRFYATEKGQQEKLSSEAKFVQVWQKKNGVWKITRIISFGHQEFLK